MFHVTIAGPVGELPNALTVVVALLGLVTVNEQD